MRYGYVSADVNRLGDYVVTIDTLPPVDKAFLCFRSKSDRKTIVHCDNN